MLSRRLLAVVWVVAIAAGCGDEERRKGSPNPRGERSDRPAEPPAGWRTFENRRAGFSVSIPRDWSARTRRGATLIRSWDRLLAITVAADRSESGRTTRPRRYAREAFRALPGFRRLRARRVRRVGRSPYANARVDGSGLYARRQESGVVSRRRQRQRITVAAFRRPRRVTFTVVAFSAEVAGAAPHGEAVTTVLASLRGQRPGG